MNDLQINYFLAVTRTGSFTAAAEELYVSQPAISKQIAKLEKEMGVTLLDRTKNGLCLTTVGKLLYDHFSDTAARISHIKFMAQQISDNAPMSLNFGVVDGWDVSGFIPQILAAIKEKFPRLSVNLKSKDSIQILKDIQEGKLDLILYSPMFLDNESTKGLTEYYATTARIIVLFSAVHPLATKPDLQIQDFAEEPFLLCMKDSGAVMDRVKNFCRQNGFEAKVEPCGKREDLFLKLQTGRGYTIFHEKVECKNNSKYKYFIPTSPRGNDMRQELCFYHRTDNHNPALHIFLKELLTVLDAKRDEGKDEVLH